MAHCSFHGFQENAISSRPERQEKHSLVPHYIVNPHWFQASGNASMILDMAPGPNTWHLLEIDVDHKLNLYDSAALKEWEAAQVKKNAAEAQNQEDSPPEEMQDQENEPALAEQEVKHEWLDIRKDTTLFLE